MTGRKEGRTMVGDGSSAGEVVRDEERGRLMEGAVRNDEQKKGGEDRETLYMEIESRSRNEEFARVAGAVFKNPHEPNLEEKYDLKKND